MQDLAADVYDLALTVERGDRELTIHPAAVETGRGHLLLGARFQGKPTR
jgi:hypothetical protein